MAGAAVPRESLPPSFVRLAAHPLRWRLLSELAGSDHRVRELCALLDRPQNLVSYHLGRLRDERLVTMRRSSADRREAYYTLELARCGELLDAAGAALHPGLRPRDRDRNPRRPRAQVLFLCTGNSGRSQIAEALLEHQSGGTMRAFSAGSHPKPVHDDAVRVMREHGIDIGDRRSKPLTEFTGRRMDFVVSLCDRVREVCPEFPRATVMHWSIADPAAAGEDAAERLAAFRRTATELAMRITFLLALVERSQTTTEVI
jgi:protein-tyrosine-phosphatase/DNA-binding transcriptional ArsR family regulator